MSFFDALGNNGGGATAKKKRNRKRKKKNKSNKQTAENPVPGPAAATPAAAPQSAAAAAPTPAPAASGNKWDDIVDVISQIHKDFSKNQIAAVVEKLAKGGKDWKNVNTVVSELKATVHKFFDFYSFPSRIVLPNIQQSSLLPLMIPSPNTYLFRFCFSC